MSEPKEKELNVSARLLAKQNKTYEEDLKAFVSEVIEFMMQTGTNIIDQENLYVHLSFEEAKIYSFVIENDFEKPVDLNTYTKLLKKKLERNRDAGIKRLIVDLENDLPRKINRILKYCKN